MAEQPSQPEASDEAQGARADDVRDDATEAMVEQALQAAQGAAETVKSHALDEEVDEVEPQGRPLQLEDLVPRQTREELAAGLGLLDDIDLTVRVELGRTLMFVEDVLRLNENSVVELDKAAGDPVDIFVNDRHVARGEVLVLNENFCVRISEIIKHADGDDEVVAERLPAPNDSRAAPGTEGIVQSGP